MPLTPLPPTKSGKLGGASQLEDFVRRANATSGDTKETKTPDREPWQRVERRSEIRRKAKERKEGTVQAREHAQYNAQGPDTKKSSSPDTGAPSITDFKAQIPDEIYRQGKEAITRAHDLAELAMLRLDPNITPKNLDYEALADALD